MKIDRCVCTNQTFEQLKELADAEGLDADGLSEACGAGGCCGLCGPYIRKTLETGQIVFHHIIIDPGDKPAPNTGSEGKETA